MFSMILFSTIIYICIILYYRIYHKFWFHQPVDFLFNLETNEGKIKSLDYTHRYNRNYTCKSWTEKKDIIDFLNENFNPTGELYNYADYSMDNSIVFKVHNNQTNEICGCISAKPIELFIKDKLNIVFYIDHLNVKEKYRGLGLATDLISYVVDTIGDHTYLFKKDIHPLPFKYFCKYKYYLVLNEKKGDILPNKLESIEIENNYELYCPPDKNSIILEKDNKKAIIFYTNILDKDKKPIYEIGYAEDEYIAQLSVNYIKENYPESSILINSLGGTTKYFKKEFLSDNYLYFYNYRIKLLQSQEIFLSLP
jgi:hypothetical protein